MPIITKTYLGIDPGKAGGLCLMSQSGQVIQHVTTPDHVGQFSSLLAGVTYACIERVHSSPQMGVASAFSFGKYTGTMIGMLEALQIPFEEVPPVTWMRALNIPKRKKNEEQAAYKRRLLTTAQKMFPKLPLWSLPKSKGLQLALCDAILIAEYCRRIYHAK